MTDQKIQIDPNWLNELSSMFQQARSNSLLLISSGLVLCGLLVGTNASAGDPFRYVITGLWCGFLAVAVAALRVRSVRIAAWTAISGSLISIWLIAFWIGKPIVLPLLGLVAGTATLLLDLPVGIAFAGLICAGLLTISSSQVNGSLRLISIVGTVGGVGLVWLAIRPLKTIGSLAWTSYQHSQELLKQSRDFQYKLQQTLDDLSFANQQLERLNRLANSLRQAEEETRRAKEQFVANVSHELRTPLNMIIGFTEMIINAPETYHSPLPHSLLADLAVVLRNSQHLASLVDDVLDLSQIEAGKMALTKEHANLSEIVAEAITAVQPLYESKNLTITLNVDPDLPSILVDPTRIREVLLNLLSNAGRFTQKGGVTIKISHREEEIITSVSDTGPGIKETDLNRMFQPFQQLDVSLRKKFGGTGLGLAISREFVEMHDGRMWLESSLGKGTTFFFTLPVSPSGPNLPGAHQWLNPDWPFLERVRRPQIPQPSLRPRILVCDSGRDLHRLLTRYLSQMDVVKTQDLAAASKELVSIPAQAVVINAGSLEEASTYLTTTPELPYATPIIACAVPSTPNVASLLGVSDHLIKPVSRQALLEAFSRLDLPHRTVLVVDDEPESLRLFRRILSAPGNDYKVLTARSGSEALRILENQKPDCMLMDLVMPEMDGFQLLSIKEANPIIQSIPVIVVSAQDATRQPILSKGLAVVRGHGLTLQQLLSSIIALSSILSPVSASSARSASEAATRG